MVGEITGSVDSRRFIAILAIRLRALLDALSAPYLRIHRQVPERAISSIIHGDQ